LLHLMLLLELGLCLPRQEPPASQSVSAGPAMTAWSAAGRPRRWQRQQLHQGHRLPSLHPLQQLLLVPLMLPVLLHCCWCLCKPLGRTGGLLLWLLLPLLLLC
jgi:hypothetical protein